MAVSVVGIIINIVMLILILMLVIAGVTFNKTLDRCENQQSPYCYTIQCPCDDKSGPCFGNARIPGPRDGTWYCSNAPNSLVDDSGSSV